MIEAIEHIVKFMRTISKEVKGATVRIFWDEDFSLHENVKIIPRINELVLRKDTNEIYRVVRIVHCIGVVNYINIYVDRYTFEALATEDFVAKSLGLKTKILMFDEDM